MGYVLFCWSYVGFICLQFVRGFWRKSKKVSYVFWVYDVSMFLSIFQFENLVLVGKRIIFFCVKMSLFLLYSFCFRSSILAQLQLHEKSCVRM